MAELHIIGRISSAKDFKQPRILCKWSFHAGNGWKVLNGCEEGQTQESCDLYTDEPVWDHPIDLHYTTQTLQNSPKLLLQTFCRDTHGRILFGSYGICNIPLSPGLHCIECHTWKPIGNWKDRLRDKFLGVTLQLKSPSALVNSLDRFQLLTESMGTVKSELYIISNIFTCANETDCDELIEEDTLEEASSTVAENIYDTISTSTSSSTYPTQTPKSQIIPTTQTSQKIKYNNEIRNYNIHKMHSDVCKCDLTVSSCDINCCCDQDCNDFHLTVFSHCENHQAELFDKRYCYNKNFIQRNNTPFILEKLANNLFCILYDNLPPTYSVNNELNIKSEKDLREAVNPNRLKWKWKDQLHVPEYNISSPYQDDDIMWIVHNNCIQPFEILQSGFTELCSFKKTLKYLREWKDKCLQTELSNTNKYLFPRAFNNFSIIASTHLLNETYIEVLDQICPRNVCLTLTSYYCKQSWKTCNNSTLLGSCFNGTCYNIVTGVKYLIVHNGSMGINSVNVYFIISNVSHHFYQQFEVTYEWVELDKQKSFFLSGNPGYIVGKPLIIGTLKINKTNNMETRYINFNRTNSFLTLPIATRSGECNDIDRYTLAFGEDVKLKCSVSVHTNNFSTTSCMELQNLTMHFLMQDSLFNVTQTDQYNIYISKTGNFSSNNTADWVQILLNRIPQSVIIGQVVNGRLSCSGLITSIHLNILYSTLAKLETLTNHNVLGIGITFTAEYNTSWSKCLTENCTNILKTDVVSYVTFHDISKPSKYYFVGGPNLDLTLPYDFFYPFLSSSTCVKSNILLFNAILSVILHISFY
ncbi:PREDICTED: tectonic-3-like [Habropoda laboriosa]|uniref:tectonic-3-like n=1 Tax=Habropoda laboriosa TaxID=597456 RepID=UPI00083D96B1|nr:PREDICTED: tectonic-3-like [Habropoda laboriosa]